MVRDDSRDDATALDNLKGRTTFDSIKIVLQIHSHIAHADLSVLLTDSYSNDRRFRAYVRVGDRVYARRDIRALWKLVVLAGTGGTIVGGGWCDGRACGNVDFNVHWEVRFDNGVTSHESESNLD